VRGNVKRQRGGGIHGRRGAEESLTRVRLTVAP
jgi:hypothetical protein